jgi:hypothetical protein
MSSGHVVVDNCISSSEILRLIADDDSFFPLRSGLRASIAEEINGYHSSNSDGYSPFMFWSGWGYEEPNTLKKKVIKCLWEKQLPCPIEEVAGFEYWTRTFVPGQYLDVHVDEDTFAYAKDKSFNAPIYGCVYYASTDRVIGGQLQLHSEKIHGSPIGVLERDSLLRLSSPDQDRISIDYKYNRAVYFDAGRTLHNTLPATKGLRKVLVVNVWHKDSPPAGLIDGEFFYE